MCGSGADENITVMKAFIYVVWFQNTTNKKSLYTLQLVSVISLICCNVRQQDNQSDCCGHWGVSEEIIYIFNTDIIYIMSVLNWHADI